MLRQESLVTLEELGSQDSGFLCLDGWSLRDERPPHYATSQPSELRGGSESSYAFFEHVSSSTSSPVLDRTPRGDYQIENDLDSGVISQEVPHVKSVQIYSRHP